MLLQNLTIKGVDFVNINKKLKDCEPICIVLDAHASKPNALGQGFAIRAFNDNAIKKYTHGVLHIKLIACRYPFFEGAQAPMKLTINLFFKSNNQRLFHC